MNDGTPNDCKKCSGSNPITAVRCQWCGEWFKQVQSSVPYGDIGEIDIPDPEPERVQPIKIGNLQHLLFFSIVLFTTSAIGVLFTSEPRVQGLFIQATGLSVALMAVCSFAVWLQHWSSEKKLQKTVDSAMVEAQRIEALK